MKTLLTSLLLSAIVVTTASADYSEPFAPLDEEAMATVDDFIPPGTKAIALAQGDLNQDDITDYALIIQKTDPDNIHGGSGLIANEIDANPRHMLLLFGNKADNAGEDSNTGETLSRKRTYRKFIPGLNPEFPDMAEPFSYIGINEGTLELKFEVWGGANSWLRDDLIFRFRYNDESETFLLTSFDHHNVHKATGMFKDVSVDLVKKEINKAAGSMSSPRHRKESGDFIPAQDWTPCDIKEPLIFFP